jgi:chromosome segregation ATPase
MVVTSFDRQSSQLDRRREQAASAAGAADKAKAGVTELDNRLQTNTSMTRQQKQALRNAEAEVNRIKRSLKAATKERDQLTRARKKAVAKADKASVKAKAADAKYEKSVLADMVRREKMKDRADAAQPPVESAGTALQPVLERSPVPVKTAAATSGRRGRTSRTATAATTPEQPDAGTTTATRTAARKTAANASVRATRGA